MGYLTMKDGVRLYYEEAGSGTPIIFIHGWKGNTAVWDRSYFDLLADGNYRCIRYEHRGHNRSDLPDVMPGLKDLADDLHEIITQLGVVKPVLVGHSMGGATILEYIRHYGSEGLEKVVIVDMSPKILCENGWTYGSRGRNFTRQHAAANVAKMKENFLEFLRGYYCGGNPGFAEKTPAEQDELIAERMLGQHPAVLTSLMSALYGRDHCDVLPQITCPTGIFHAEVMPVCNTEVAEYYQENIPAVTKVVCFRGGSHALITEQPDRFVSELKAFLTE